MNNGYNNGPQGNFNGPQGNYNGPLGNFNGPQGNFNGPQSNFNGPQGNFNGPQRNFNAPQGQYNGMNNAYPPQQMGPSAGKPSGKKKLSPVIIVVIVLAGVLLLAGAGVLIFHFVSGKANDTLYAIERDYASGNIGYDEATDRLDAMRGDKDISTEDIAYTEDYLKEIREEKEAFEDAEECMEDDDYVGAIRNYRMITHTENSDYDEAIENLEECEEEYKNSVLKKADKYADDEDYYSAAKVLEDALQLLSEDGELKSRYSEYRARLENNGAKASETVITDPKIVSAETLAGEVLAASNVSESRTFTADNAIDGFYDTCWCVNTNSTGGAGGEIIFRLSGLSQVSGISMINGNLYHPYDDIYLSNGQVKSFTLTFSNGETKKYTVGKNTDASSEFVYFTFDEPVETEYIILTVDSGYAGKKYTTNVALGEFDVY